VGRFRGWVISKWLGWVYSLEENMQSSCPCNGLHAVLHLEFTTYLATIPFDRADGKDEPVGDFAVGHSLRHQVKDFKLAGREGIGKRLGMRRLWLVHPFNRRRLNRCSSFLKRKRRGLFHAHGLTFSPGSVKGWCIQLGSDTFQMVFVFALIV
jgi:hypothetical protein